MSNSHEVHQSAVRLRVPERRQMAAVVECPDDLVSAGHSVRLVMAVVEKLDVSRFCEPIKAREGQAGRDATESSSAGCAVVVRDDTGHRLGAGTGAAL